ncbi:MAG: tetratricopeptide repeat protein [Bacteroidia bacterium]|nr:tetratricopeptide repeat protein [Bacteroidia bacterium]MBT8275336.1 tetratricopeptide repeat protein [Bacteroidia bacterium]NNJ82285.1 tetratricopeptide repeat protein [Flavobacteriaceae bacterium]NNK54998.1 tetratricopeptide repeat protein [Flavobacteriaceae bacterium]NNM09617.1 tetratricopeptide repeat protein [Flavobacteriaceae bacterium]
MKYFFAVCLIIIAISCNNSTGKEEHTTKSATAEDSYEAIGLLGDTLRSAEPSEELLQRYLEKKAIYDSLPDDLDNLIWFGRFTAYKGDYRKAIEIYSEGLKKFPNESRLLRHRGHRYISIREFDKATKDLGRAAKLIEGKENQTEPDGMPNARNIPVSSMHGNIYYHLGLAYYLKQDMRNALEAYKKCLETSTSPDNVVSATHWIYMINRRMGRLETADQYLQNISADMDVIENDAYHTACLVYKGIIEADDVYEPGAEESPSGSALKYAIGNWHFYNGERDKARQIFEEIVAGKDWASFGFIAAESDLNNYF